MPAAPCFLSRANMQQENAVAIGIVAAKSVSENEICFRKQ
jgi:hypothetical protein